MLGKVIVFALLAPPLGILIGLNRHPLTEALGGALFLAGSAIVGAAIVLAFVMLIEGLLFRGPDRWTRFN